MRWMCCGFLSGLLLGGSLPAPMQAAELAPAQVDAKAKWVIHVDVDAIRSTKGAEKAAGCDKVKDMVAKVKEKTGLDLGKDLHGMTLYGTTFEPFHGVLVVFADADREKIAGLIKEKPDYKSEKHGEATIHTFTEAKGKKHEHTAHLSMVSDKVHVIGRHTDEVKAAIDLVGGKGTGLGADSELGKAAPKGTTVLARASGVSEATAKMKAKSHLAKEVEAFSINMGETEGVSFLNAVVNVKTEVTAKQMLDVLNGFKAMAQLKHGGDADAKALIDGGKATLDGANLTVAWTGPADKVLEVMEKNKEKRHEWRKKWKEKHEERKKDKEEKQDEKK